MSGEASTTFECFGARCSVHVIGPGAAGPSERRPHPCQPLCRHDNTLDPGAGNVNEGRCVLGPIDQTCALAHQVTCTSDANCSSGQTCMVRGSATDKVCAQAPSDVSGDCNVPPPAPAGGR